MELNDIKKLKKGIRKIIILIFEGDVYSWGWNNYGQIGNGQNSGHSNIPSRCDGLKKNFVKISSPFNMGLALSSKSHFAFFRSNSDQRN